MSDQEKMREEFEKRAAALRLDLARGFSQRYAFEGTQTAWELWQACAAHYERQLDLARLDTMRFRAALLDVLSVSAVSCNYDYVAVVSEIRQRAGKVITAADTSALDSMLAEARKVPGWQPIETAPKDGTVVDLYIPGEFACRVPDCFWGKPIHSCGAMGQFCDDDFHNLVDGWVDGATNHHLWQGEPTHWRHIPASPQPEETEGKKI